MILSICIPTYNRLGYLKELIDVLIRQIDALQTDVVELVISDNCSTDGTSDFCQSLDLPYVRFWRNDHNIGGDRNFLKCIREAAGKYVWLVGDDDIVEQNGVSRIVECLMAETPALVIADGARSERAAYGDYRTCLLAEQKRLRSFALAHSLISANIFQKDLFDMQFAESRLWTQYSHMFGLVRRLVGKIVVMPGIVRVREVRADFAKYPSFLCVKQALYLWYLAGRFELPGYRMRAMSSVCNLPLEFGSRVKFHLLKMARFLFG